MSESNGLHSIMPRAGVAGLSELTKDSVAEGDGER